ncbi:hypothetical protein CDAR_196861 [Caerostris darwini]|uniref:Uncharacterized protein n=1 Tax=Caerostris darwini TaxID=1538125 RepID=A0AAV4PWN6_9ARAC|nr:hypothetical protein CDAR_196861 [Caerostris darwini]
MENVCCLENGPKGIVVRKDKRQAKVEGPDEGYAWSVAIAACVINFIMNGLGRMSGILFVAFMELYEVDRKSASMPFSVRSSARNLIGPIVGILGQKYGVRSITMFGGVVATSSIVACFFASEITWITILWGGMNGLGNTLTVTLPQVIIGQYFNKYKTTASGMAFSGGCVGSFVFPILLEYLIETYGMQGTFLILGGIVMHTIPAAMILVKPSWLKKPRRASVSDDVESADIPKIQITLPEGYSSEKITARKFPNDGPNLHYLRRHFDIVIKMLAAAPVKCLKLVAPEVNIEKSRLRMESCLRIELEDLLMTIERAYGLSHFHQNLTLAKNSLDVCGKEPLRPMRSMKGPYLSVEPQFFPSSLQKSKSVPDLCRSSEEMPKDVLLKLKVLNGMKFSQISTTCPRDGKLEVLKISRELKKLYHITDKLNQNERDLALSREKNLKVKTLNKSDGNSHSNSFLDHIKTAIKLHTNPFYLLICLCRIVHFVAFIPTMTFVVDFVMDKGLLEQDGKYAIAALAVGDLIGRLGFGWVTDKGYLTMPKYIMIVMIAQGASTAFLPLMHTKITIFIFLGIFGMLQGSLFVRHPVLVSRYMKSHEQSIAMGCVNFFSGIIGLGLPVYIGYFRDTLGSYDCIFYLNGTLGALVGLLWALEPRLQRWSSKVKDEPEDSA